MKVTHKILFVAVLFTGMLATSCSEDKVTPQAQSIVEIASADPQFSSLVAALTKAELVTTLEGTGPFTVFAPTNTAFAELLGDLGVSSLDDLSKEDLKPILLNHVIVGQFKSTDLSTSYVSTASNTGPDENLLDLYIEVGSGVNINSSVSVTSADIIASNGVIHVVDKVIVPTDVVDIAANNDEFTSLVDALGSAEGDLVSVLKGDGPFTVFAPVNSAFADIADVVATLDAAQLADVLKYHVVSGANVRSSDLMDGMTVTTLSGTFTVNITGGTVTLTDESGATVNVVATDIQGTNGVVHVIDKVLLK